MKVLMFHEIIGRENEVTGWNIDTNGKYSVSVEVFERFVSYFKNRFIYTFDDGGKSNLIAAKILEKYKCVGIFFIVTSRINTVGFLKQNEVDELAKNHFVYSHSHNHTMISQSYNDLRTDYETSFHILKSLHQFNQKVVSLPGGTITSAHMKVLNDLGVKTIYHSAPSNVVLRMLYECDIEFIPRIVMNQHLCEVSIRKCRLVSSWFVGCKSYLKQLKYAFIR